MSSSPVEEVEFDGGVYKGHLDEEGRFHGRGVAHYTSGDVYEGEFQDDVFHGQGTYKWADGDIYSGEYYEDQQHGFGSLTDVTGTYTGTWVYDKRHGYGKQTFAGSGEVYEGEWFDDKRHGYGRVTQKSNEGSTTNGGASGILPSASRQEEIEQKREKLLNAQNYDETLTLADQTTGFFGGQSFYEGGWQSNSYHGRGMSKNPDGDQYEGEFQRGKPHGQGIYEWATGITYLGSFVDGKKHGEGREKLPGGSWLQGRWVAGMADRSIVATKVDADEMRKFENDFRRKYCFVPKVVTNPNKKEEDAHYKKYGGGDNNRPSSSPNTGGGVRKSASSGQLDYGFNNSDSSAPSTINDRSASANQNNGRSPSANLPPVPSTPTKQYLTPAPTQQQSNNSNSNNQQQPNNSSTEVFQNNSSSNLAMSVNTNSSSNNTVRHQQQQNNNNNNYNNHHQMLPSGPSVTEAELEGYMIARLLGKGSFGSVFEALLPCGKQVCVKQIELGNIKSDDELKTLMNEINLMKRLHHTNIVEYYGCKNDQEKNTLYIFMELVTGGTVNHFVKRLKTVPLRTVRSWTKQTLAGVQYLHLEGIIHRDIKGDNILVSGDGIVKLADFGCSKQIDDVCSRTRGCNTMVGTPYWMAPEVIKCEADTGYGAKSDIWSIGCTVVEMITGRPPWPESDSMWAAVFKIANSTGLPPGIPENLPPEVMEFLARCFERDPKKRATADELLQLPWMVTGISEQK